MNIRKSIKDLLYIFNKNPFSKIAFRAEINKRSKLPFTEVELLSKHINMFAPYTNEIQPVNDWYGHATILKNFLGLPLNYQFKFIIEHGTYFSDQVADIELEYSLPSVVTYSPYRVEVFKKYNKRAYAIGPLIHYTPHYLTSEQLAKEKKRIGKTLLFFPSHSVMGLTNEYDIDWSCKKIKKIAKDYDTVRVCIYWKDVLLDMHKYYQQWGFECVTAGHILDPLFLSRVKSIIHNADLTISNDVSSPLNYCIYMNKPYIIFYQRPQMLGKNNLKKVILEGWKSKPYQQIVKEFSKIQFSITAKQKKLMNYYAGINSIKTKKELLKIVEATEEIFQNK